MKHRDEKIEEAARRFETLADELDPGLATVGKTSPICAPSPRTRPLGVPGVKSGGDASGGDVVHVAGDAHLR